MRDLALGLVPGTLVYSHWFGLGVLINVCLGIVFCMLLEALVVWARQRNLYTLSDHSALVAGWLLGLSMPVGCDWWLVPIGAFFAIVVAKHAYGGLGHNLFNPAMVGYAVLIISFPDQMSRWIDPSHTASLNLWQSLDMTRHGSEQWDALTQATPLDQVRSQTIWQLGTDSTTLSRPYLTLAAAWLIGGLWLLYRGIISWHIPAGVLLGLTIMATGFHLIDDMRYPTPAFHLIAGASILGAFFIATDPSTAATSRQGRLIYALMIGMLTYCIRTWGGYPDGIAFAVLIANMCAPLIDHWTRPRPFGHAR